MVSVWLGSWIKWHLLGVHPIQARSVGRLSGQVISAIIAGCPSAVSGLWGCRHRQTRQLGSTPARSAASPAGLTVDLRVICVFSCGLVVWGRVRLCAAHMVSALWSVLQQLCCGVLMLPESAAAVCAGSCILCINPFYGQRTVHWRGLKA